MAPSLGSTISKANKAMYFTKNNININGIKLKGVNLTYVNQQKFLGILFDSPLLTWQSHINQIATNCQNGLALLKSITNIHWGSDRKSLLMLYKSLVRSKMDYGSHLYDNSTKIITKKLDTIQNQCLRISMSLRQTTPILSIHAEAVIPPLSISRKFLLLKYYKKIKNYNTY